MNLWEDENKTWVWMVVPNLQQLGFSGMIAALFCVQDWSWRSVSIWTWKIFPVLCCVIFSDSSVFSFWRIHDLLRPLTHQDEERWKGFLFDDFQRALDSLASWDIIISLFGTDSISVHFLAKNKIWGKQENIGKIWDKQKCSSSEAVQQASPILGDSHYWE